MATIFPPPILPISFTLLRLVTRLPRRKDFLTSRSGKSQKSREGRGQKQKLLICLFSGTEKCVKFLMLLWTRGLFSYSCRGRQSKRSFAVLKPRCWQDHASSKRDGFLLFPASRAAFLGLWFPSPRSKPAALRFTSVTAYLLSLGSGHPLPPSYKDTCDYIRHTWITQDPLLSSLNLDTPAKACFAI